MKENQYFKVISLIIGLSMSILMLFVLGRWWSSDRIARRLTAAEHKWKSVCEASAGDHGRFARSGMGGDFRWRWMPGWHYSFDNGEPTNEPSKGCTVFVPLIGEPLEIETWAKVIEH
jgi:hypothetical protein